MYHAMQLILACTDSEGEFLCLLMKLSHEKTNNLGFRLGLTRNRLYSHISYYVVDSVLLRMSRYVTAITAREVYRYKMAYHGDKFLHIGAVTIVNISDHKLHCAI